MFYFLTVFCFILTSFINAQHLSSGMIHACDLNSNREDLSCWIEYFDNNRYVLTMEFQESPDIIKAQILSGGHYKNEGKKLLLFDEIHGFTLRYTLIEFNQLVQEHGFTFLINKIMTLYPNNTQTAFPPIPFNAATQKQRREKYLRQYYFSLPFTPGIYESEYNTVKKGRYTIFETGLDYEINIMRNGRYVLQYKRIAISEGTWERKENEIVLFDENLQHNFYLLISNRSLISMYLPGEFRAITLHLKQKEINIEQLSN